MSDETYMPAAQVHKLVDVLVQCIMMVHMERVPFEGKTCDEVGEWVRNQLSGCGFPSRPIGMAHVKLYNGLFEEAEIPRHVLDELVGCKALAVDYKFILDSISTAIDGSADALRTLAMRGLAEESEDSRLAITKAKSSRT